MNYFTGGTPLQFPLGRPDMGSTPGMPHMGGMQNGFRGRMFTGGTPLQGGWNPAGLGGGQPQWRPQPQPEIGGGPLPQQWGAMPQPEIQNGPQPGQGWNPAGLGTGGTPMQGGMGGMAYQRFLRGGRGQGRNY